MKKTDQDAQCADILYENWLVYVNDGIKNIVVLQDTNSFVGILLDDNIRKPIFFLITDYQVKITHQTTAYFMIQAVWGLIFDFSFDLSLVCGTHNP